MVGSETRRRREKGVRGAASPRRCFASDRDAALDSEFEQKNRRQAFQYTSMSSLSKFDPSVHRVHESDDVELSLRGGSHRESAVAPVHRLSRATYLDLAETGEPPVLTRDSVVVVGMRLGVGEGKRGVLELVSPLVGHVAAIAFDELIVHGEAFVHLCEDEGER